MNTNSFHLTSDSVTAREDAPAADLHAAMMNLPCKVPTTLVSDVTREHYLLADDPVIRAYRVGHRDARHAAAELALQADATKEELVDALRVAVSYLAPRVLGTGGDGDKRVLPILNAAIAKATGEQQ